MATAVKKTPTPEPVKKGSGDYLLQALEDLGRAREQAQEEARTHIDSAVDRIRDAKNDLSTRARDEADDLQSRLDSASEDLRRELGRTAVRAQRTPEALTAMQAEIRDRKRKLNA
jgi:signal transduction histidine kinase